MKKTALSFITFLVISSTSNLYANDNYQTRVLFEPGEAQLAAEARGHIMIYDGMLLPEVNRAMDEQFERIENMMFVRTVIPTEFGEDELEEDGCD